MVVGGVCQGIISSISYGAGQRFKIKYTLMTTDAVYDKEILISSHLERQRRVSANQNQPHPA